MPEDGITLTEKARLIRAIATSTAEANARVVKAFNQKQAGSASQAAAATDFIQHNKELVSPQRNPIAPKGREY
jgi:hypothetical protein